MRVRMNGLSGDAWADAVHVPLTRDELHAKIVVALEISGGRRNRAARLLGISAKTLRRVYGPKPGRWGKHVIPEPGP